MIKLLVLVASGLAVATAHQHLACVGTEQDGTFTFMPSPQACSKYILCLNGEAHPGECENGNHFDAGRQACGAAEFIDCTQCGPIGFVKLPHPDSCQQYFECTFGQRKVRTCPEGHNFDRQHGTCNRAELVQCEGGDDDGSPPLEPPGTPPPNGDNGDNGENGPLPTCRRGQVHHAHNSNCNRYFLCVQGTLWEHRCPSNLHWNERAMACDLPKSARCINGEHNGGGGGGGGPSGPEITPPNNPPGPGGPGGPGDGPVITPFYNRRLVRLAEDDVLY